MADEIISWILSNDSMKPVGYVKNKPVYAISCAVDSDGFGGTRVTSFVGFRDGRVDDDLEFELRAEAEYDHSLDQVQFESAVYECISEAEANCEKHAQKERDPND